MADQLKGRPFTCTMARPLLTVLSDDEQAIKNPEGGDPPGS
jgi:hypothetical protein